MKFFYAVAALVGGMVGVGIFGIPFAFMRAGFWVGFFFLILTAGITLIMDLIYGEIILRTQAQHQIVGYTERYAGETLKSVLFFALALSIYSALLAYIVIAGDFLSNIFSSFGYFSPAQYSIVFVVILSGLILAGVKRFSPLEFVLSLLFLTVIGLIFGFGFGHIQVLNLVGWTPVYWFLPYGVLMFAFSGMAAIPIQREILKGKESKFKKAIIVSVVLTAALYFVFSLTVVGISGDVTTPDAVSGLFEFLGGKIIFLTSFFGILAVSSAFLVLGSAIMELYMYDYGFKKKYAWLLVVLPPILLFMIGVRTFINIIALAGTVAVSLESVILVFVYAKAKSRGDRIPEYSLNIPIWFLYLIILLFLAGVGYSLLT